MSEKKKQIIETAFRLFSENGFYATGIDQIIAESQTSKKTLYTYFKSKNDLILSVLEHYRISFFDDLNRAVLEGDAPADVKLLQIFDIAYQWYRSKKFNGCLAISAMNEFGNKDPEIAKACALFKEAERTVLFNVVREIGVSDPDCVADQLFLLLEGITATAHIGSMVPDVDDIHRLVRGVCDGL